MAAALAEKASAATWRSVLAFLAAALSALACSGGLFASAPSVQVGVLVGTVAGLVAPSVAASVMVSAVAALLGGVAGPANAWYGPAVGAAAATSVATTVAVAALVAAGVRLAASRRPALSRWILWAAVALVVANLWATTLSANSESAFDPITGTAMPSFNEQLDGRIPEAIAGSDDAWFYRVYTQLRAGEGYYGAFHEALVGNPRWEPSDVMAYRLPTLFYFWMLLPGPRSVPIAFLALASAGVVAVATMGRGVVKAPLAIPACAAVASYFVYFPVQLVLFSQEAWAAAIGLVCLAFAVASYSGERWRVLTVIAVGLAVCATLVRETIAFLPLAGLVTSVAFPDERRRFRVGAWGAGAVVLAVAYSLHFAATRGLVTPVPGSGRLWKGSAAAAFAALEYATDMLGAGTYLPWLLAVLGLCGIALLPDARVRVFAAIATVAPLASFLVVGNRAWYETTGVPINYWGATVAPLLYAFFPVALSFVPGAAVTGIDRRLR